ncbi:MAG: hypothetical protein ACRC7H_00580 [Plesiomonas shigelloides]
MSTEDGEQSVTLTCSPLSTDLRGAGLGGIFNGSEAIDHFPQSAAFDLKVNVDGFLVSIYPANESGSSGMGELWNANEARTRSRQRKPRQVLWPEEESFQRSVTCVRVNSRCVVVSLIKVFFL